MTADKLNKVAGNRVSKRNYRIHLFHSACLVLGSLTCGFNSHAQDRATSASSTEQKKSDSVNRTDSRPASQAEEPVKEPAKESPPYRGLDASLYMQTSAEFRACCIQTFSFAELVAHQNLLNRVDASKPPAVVMDLDETILDNGWFQSDQIRQELAFDPIRWAKWELEGADRVRLMPGAKGFIDRLRKLGIEHAFITNRNEEAHEQTLLALKRLEIEVPSDRLLCASKETGTNKTSRRAKFEAKLDVLLYVGDNLRDFDERFRFGDAGIEGRAKVVDELAHQFGTKWIILPNPSYGEWNKAFKNSPDDAHLLYK